MQAFSVLDNTMALFLRDGDGNMVAYNSGSGLSEQTY
jgi:hypothetical protein